MSVLYLLTAPEPPIAGTDALYQEIDMLLGEFGGAVLNLNPRKSPGSAYPPQLFGLHNLLAIRRAERSCRVTHVYYSIPYYFQFLRFVRNPVVFTSVASLKDRDPPHDLDRLRTLRRIVVSNPRDAEQLSAWGITNYSVVPPGIDTSRLSCMALPMNDRVTLLMASAPWTREQFELKGVELLLNAAARDETLDIILLWRGLLLGELREQIRMRGLKDRVEVISERVNVDDYLGRAHAAVLLAKRGDIVKAYPHSLMESLAAGKPVILSAAIAMADYVNQKGCGIVVDETSDEAFAVAVETLRRNYNGLAAKARLVGPSDFSQSAMIEAYRRLYGF